MNPIIKYLSISAAALVLGGIFYKMVFVPKHTFETLSPVKGELAVSVRGIGNVDALHVYPITAQTGGKIVKILADDGTRVKKGELLIEIDGVDLQQQKDSANASVLKGRFDIQTAQSDLENLQAQKGLVQITYDRYRRLFEKRFVSKAEYDKASADIGSIKAAIAASTSRIEAAKAASTAASKNKEALDQKIIRLKVYAPSDGYIVSREAEVAQSVTSSTPILTLVDPKTLWVKTKIDERISKLVRPMQKATIVLRSQPLHPYMGTVRRIGSTTDPITLEREIYVAFDTPPIPFYLNEQAKVQIEVKNYPQVFKVPARIIVQNGDKSGFWEVDNGHARFVEANVTVQNDTEVVLDGVDTHRRIIIPDATKTALSEGMKIYP